MSRTEALRALGRTFVWLRVHDTKWLDARLPARRGRVGERAIRASQDYWKELDASAGAFVVERHARLHRQASRPRRVTHAQLLAGFPRANELYRHSAALPFTTGKLRELVESSSDYKHRLALWLVLHPEAVPKGLDPLDYAYRATRVPKADIVRTVESRIARGPRKNRVDK